MGNYWPDRLCDCVIHLKSKCLRSSKCLRNHHLKSKCLRNHPCMMHLKSKCLRNHPRVIRLQSKHLRIHPFACTMIDEMCLCVLTRTLAGHRSGISSLVEGQTLPPMLLCGRVIRFVEIQGSPCHGPWTLDLSRGNCAIKIDCII